MKVRRVEEVHRVSLAAVPWHLQGHVWVKVGMMVEAQTLPLIREVRRDRWWLSQ